MIVNFSMSKGKKEPFQSFRFIPSFAQYYNKLNILITYNKKIISKSYVTKSLKIHKIPENYVDVSTSTASHAHAERLIKLKDEIPKKI